ncbi:MAG: AsmA family protein [Proteobacteria bacterium]|nr:AsmA family protein [Pseudomonadota bacterium]
MRKYIAWLVASLVVLLSIAYYAPKFANFNAYKDRITQSLSAATELSMQIDGDVHFTILPLPKLFISDIKANSATEGEPVEVMQVEEMVINLPLFAIFNLKGNWVPKKIEMRNAELNYTPMAEHMHNLHTKQTLSTLPQLQFTNATLRHLEGGYSVKDINLLINPGSILKPYGIQLTSNFSWRGKKYDIAIDTDDLRPQHKAHLSFSGTTQGNTVHFNGEAQDVLEYKNFKGQATFEINDISNSTNNGKQEKNSARIQLTADVEASPDMVMINNVKSNSDSISGVDAKLSIQLAAPMSADLQVTIDTITIPQKPDTSAKQKDKSTTKKESAIVQDSASLMHALEVMIDNFDFELPQGLLGQAQIKIGAIKYAEQSATNLTISANSKDDVITINNCDASLPGSTNFKLTGNITHNSIRPQLQGSISFVSQDLATLVRWLAPNSETPTKTLGAYADIMLMPHHLNLTNVDASMDNMSFKGGLGIYHSAKTQMSINSDIVLSNIDANSFGIAQQVDDFIYQLFLGDEDKTGTAFNTATRDFNWLRVFPISWSCDLEVSNLQYKDYTFDRAVISFSIDSGRLLFSKIAANSNLATFDGSLNMTLPSFRPRIEGDMSFAYLDTSFFTSILPSFSGMHARQLQATSAKSDTQYTPSDFNFFSLGQYDGSMKVNVDELHYGEYVMTNIIASALMDDIALTVDGFTATAFGGDIRLQGSISSKTPIASFNFAFGLDNVNPNGLLKIITGADKINGYLSANGKLSSNARTWHDFYDRLTGEVKLVGSKIMWNGFSLPDIIDVVDKKAPLASKLERLEYYINNGETNFDVLTGNIKIDNGIASLNDFAAKNNRSNGVFVGQYAIASNQLSSIAKFVFIPIGENTPLTLQLQSQGEMTAQQVTADYDSIKKFVASRNVDSPDTGSVETILQNRRS